VPLVIRIRDWVITINLRALIWIIVILALCAACARRAL
jgi:hypothetical protein